jgi:hypothetical protein
MTETEWLACTDPDAMLDFLRAGERLSPRKARLFAVAACRRIRRLYADEKNFEAIEVAEADAEAVFAHDGAERDWVRRCRRMAAASALSPDSHEPLSTEEEVIWTAAFEAEGAAQAPLLRCLFGPMLFRCVSPPSSALTGSDGRVPKLAQSAYSDRLLPSGELEPARLLTLADALEETGCVNMELLSHLRGPGPHVRGCWVVDCFWGRVDAAEPGVTPDRRPLGGRAN